MTSVEQRRIARVVLKRNYTIFFKLEPPKNPEALYVQHCLRYKSFFAPLKSLTTAIKRVKKKKHRTSITNTKTTTQVIKYRNRSGVCFWNKNWSVEESWGLLFRGV